MLFLPLDCESFNKAACLLAQRKQNGDEKPTRPPKMPKPAKEARPPRPRKEPKLKEPKVAKPKPVKQPRERKPKAPCDPQSAKQRQRPKKGSLGRSESNTPSPSLVGEDYGDGCAGGSGLENGYSLDGGEDDRVNGDRVGTSRPHT